MIKILLPTNYFLIIFIGFSIILLLSGFSYQKIAKKADNSTSKASFYELKAIGIDGEEILFDQYKGKKVL